MREFGIAAIRARLRRCRWRMNATMAAHRDFKTTRAVRDVRGIEDIAIIESAPYDENIPARSLYDLLLATANNHPDRPALTTLAEKGFPDPTASLTHAELLAAVTEAANLFHTFGAGAGGATAVLCPTLPEIPVALLGAQVAGVASAINYLLSVEAIADLLIAEGASISSSPASTAIRRSRPKSGPCSSVRAT